VSKHAELTEKNRAIMAQVAQALFVENDAVKFGTFVSDDEYIQHNPEIPDGKEAVIEYLRKAFANSKEFAGAIHRIVVDGDIAVTHSSFRRLDGSPGGIVLMDVFRLHDGKLVEHWDVIQPMPTQSANEHPMI
jgi:predicted SnoaL-like aldol condensation-catalyzing enzyme